MLRLRDARVIDPASGHDGIADVWIDGGRLLADRTHTRLDAATVAARAALWRERLA